MIIANYMAENTDLDQIWMVVSPHNPLKEKKTLAKDFDRLHLMELAIGNNPLIRASDIEFYLPKPSYTVDTLAYLKEKYPEKNFSLIMGGDNIATLHKWKNYELILNHEIFVYRRPNYEEGDLMEHKNVRSFDAPMLDISASYIRKCIKNKKSIRYLVPDKVYDYLEVSPIYKNL